MHTSVIQAVIQGVVSSGMEMGLIGVFSNSWCEKQGGGGYSATVPPAEGSDICTSYGGSTHTFKRRLPNEHFRKTYRDKYLNNELYKVINTGRPTVWNTLFEFETGFRFQDKWSMLRQKLLESFMLALFALYHTRDFNRVKRELQIAQLWTGHSLQTREEMETFVQLRKIEATNRSIPYAEEYQAIGDPFKHAFDGAHAYAVCEASGAYYVSVGGMTGC